MRIPVLFSLLVAVFASFSVQANDTNLIGYWSFDEDSGSVAVDQTGGFPGTIYNATRVTGRVGGALEFNGSNSYVLVGGIGSALQLAHTNYTIAWWQKTGASTGWHEDIICMDDGADYSGGWQIYLPFGAPQISLVHCDGISGQENVWFNAANSDSQWHHYAVTFDGAVRNFYTDGVLTGTRSTPRAIVTDGNDPLLFGAMRLQGGTVVNFFNGSLDEIRIYNRTLNANEVSILGPGKDTNAPVVSITSPATGLVPGSPVKLEGDVTDDRRVQSARWKRNGVEMGTIDLNAGHFSFNAEVFTGETRLTVVATDAAGNEGSSEIIVIIAPTSPSADDLWDARRGTIVTEQSAAFAESGAPGFLGGDGISAEPGATIFQDGLTNGYVHWSEWKTVDAVTLSNVRLFAQGNTTNDSREIGKFTLKIKSPGSSAFDVTVFSFVPTHPYFQIDPSSGLILETNFPAITAQEFRGEFEQSNFAPDSLNGPRILELDAFGPTNTGAPAIINQPVAKQALAGSTVTFAVGAVGASPLQYQWQHSGTNLTESTHFNGVQSWKLAISDLTMEDAGDYSAIVSNSLDHATSEVAGLTVVMDTNAPLVTIVSPLTGSQQSGTFTLQGTVAEEYGLSSVFWELNGVNKGPLSLTDGHFSVGGLNFDLGENRIKVIATDASGNIGTAEVVANWLIPRLVTLGGSPVQQEGGRISIPVTLSSTGGVSGATIVVGFNSSTFTDAQFESGDALVNGFVSFNVGAGTVKFSFALPGAEIPAGSTVLGTVSFRARSVPANVSTPLTVSIQDISSANGDLFTDGNYLRGTTATVTKRKIIGDNNANDRLDVGDASLILRLIAGLDTPRSWDIPANDINKSLSIDSGDVIRVLRAVVGIDSQPQIPVAPLSLASFAVGQTSQASDFIELAFDKPTALPGEKITVEVRLKNQILPVEAASFRLEYPIDALRLENSSAHVVGTIVPTGAITLWNVSPNQNNYEVQDGAITLAVSSANSWNSTNGILARFTFTVQSGATLRYGWPVLVKNLELSRDGFQNDQLGGAASNFTARAPVNATFASSVSFDSSSVAQLVLHGDLGATYRVEASTDLANWVLIGQYSTTTDGTIAIRDSEGAGSKTRFYRATLVP